MDIKTEEEFSGLSFIQDDNNELTCEAYEEFREALDILYIQRNLSGRLNFLEAWPVAAQYLFGDELIRDDSDGVKDIERRTVLEAEAEERRVELLEIVENVHENSVLKGTLQSEYVDPMVKRLGRDLSLLIYSEKIVNRFLPQSVEVEVPAMDVDPEAEAPASPSVPQNPVSDMPDDINVENLELGQPNDDMARLNKIGEKPQDADERPRSSAGAFSPVDPPSEAVVESVSDKPKMGFDEVEDELDAIQPISVGSEVPPDAEPLTQEVEVKADGPPMSPEESEYFRPNQWSNEGTPGAASGEPVGEIKNDAMAGIKVSQKMTFVPSKKDGEEEEAPKSGIVPVIGSSAEKPQDEG